MPNQVVNSAQISCSFGATPASLTVLPVNRTRVGNQPAANIQDHVPMLNIPSFGMCSSLANPAVASATSAAAGVLTPQPCVPVTAAPWVPGAPTVEIAGQPALDDTSRCGCAWQGVISITSPGQSETQVP